jgi:hypothetical protein
VRRRLAKGSPSFVDRDVAGPLRRVVPRGYRRIGRI